MVKFKITYMVDPGDGIESTVEYIREDDDMSSALVDWFNEGHEYFVTKCEIIEHPHMG